MFVRIYSGLILIILAAILACYVIFSSINTSRLIEYNESIYQGTFFLIREGLSRHQGAKREEWLGIVERLSGLKLKLSSSDKIDLDAGELEKLKRGSLVFRFAGDKENFQVFAGLNSTVDSTLKSDDKPFQLVTTYIDSVSEQQLRVSALLVLNELGRFGSHDRADKIKRLQEMYSFPLLIENMSSQRLDNEQKKRLKSGSVVVSLEINTQGNEVLNVYSLINKREPQVLVLGPIPIFQVIPVSLLVTLIFISLLITGFGAYLMVRRLEGRLKNMTTMVQQFGPGYFNTRVQDAGLDTVSELAGSFNGMAERISDLILDQKHMTQAVAHELRTPISRMKFRLDLISAQFESEDDPVHDKISGLKNDLLELNALVDETLFFQQLESGDKKEDRPQQVISQFSMEECISDVKAKLTAMYPNKQIEFVSDIDDSRAEAYVFYLARLIQNLMSNALRYSERKVLVRFSIADDNYVLTVEDDGQGIEPEHWQTIFQPFKRVESSRNKKLGGFGLGLAIVSRIADMHNGEVSLSNSDLGGACFTFEWSKKLSKQ